MKAHAKSLIIKAQDDLNLAKANIDNQSQHDIVGYNLAQACENFLKALCEMRELEYPTDDSGHDLDNLMQILEEHNFAAISSHADIIELNPYNSTSASIRPQDRLDLYEYVGYVENLKNLVGEQVKIF